MKKSLTKTTILSAVSVLTLGVLSTSAFAFIDEETKARIAAQRASAIAGVTSNEGYELKSSSAAGAQVKKTIDLAASLERLQARKEAQARAAEERMASTPVVAAPVAPVVAAAPVKKVTEVHLSVSEGRRIAMEQMGITAAPSVAAPVKKVAAVAARPLPAIPVIASDKEEGPAPRVPSRYDLIKQSSTTIARKDGSYSAYIQLQNDKKQTIESARIIIASDLKSVSVNGKVYTLTNGRFDYDGVDAMIDLAWIKKNSMQEGLLEKINSLTDLKTVMQNASTTSACTASASLK